MVDRTKSFLEKWGILITLLLQFAGFVWFAATEHSRLVAVESWIAENKMQIACIAEIKNEIKNQSELLRDVRSGIQNWNDKLFSHIQDDMKRKVTQ